MGIFGSFDISASGLTANRLWMDVIASNIANAQTTRTAEGGPYRRKEAVFSTKYYGFQEPLLEGGQGVRVVAIEEDESPPRLVYQPGHPDAREDGYVEMPNVDPVTEMVDMLIASRAYEANATAMEAAKAMIVRALDMLR